MENDMDLVQELEKRYFLIAKQVGKEFPYHSFASEMGSFWNGADVEIRKTREKETYERFLKSLSPEELKYLKDEKRAFFLRDLLPKEAAC